MSSIFGRTVRVSVFGQSHSDAIGVTVDGLPAGEPVDLEELARFLERRAPGRSPLATARREADAPEILCGLLNGKTCGAPLTAIIRNTDTRSADYDRLRDVPRPSHADYAANVRYGGYQDHRGGGHFSGRLTAPLCIAGGICLQILARRGVSVGAHISGVGGIADALYDPVSLDAGTLASAGMKTFPVLDDRAGAEMQALIARCREEGDSVGGTVECGVVGMPAGVGDPMFDGIENRLAAALFGIPAVKGIQFGEGFRAAELRGSENNDPYEIAGGKVRTRTNRAGGVTGGISTGMPILFSLAIKPTPSIAIEQDSVSLSDMTPRKLTVAGRHDPCIVPRAVPVVEAVTAAVILDMLSSKGSAI